MAGIRISGMASGLPPNIVEQIMEAEKIPLKQLETKKSGEEEKYKLVQDLETKVSAIPKSLTELVGIRGFSNMKLTTGDQNVITGTADPSEAGTGTWMVEVDQLAQKPGALSSGFPDPDQTQIGVGYLRFNTAGGQKDVYIDGKSNTLKGVAAAINRANVGLRATVLNDRKDKENPWKIMVTGLATGSDKQVDFPTVYMLDGDQDFSFDTAKPAQNAKLKLDGFEIEVPDNQVKDVIPGVTLDLRSATPGKEVAVTVKEDLDVISGKVKTFVDAYNAVLAFVQDQHKIQKGKDGREHLGPMGGDGLLRTIESNFRRAILSPSMGTGSTIKLIAEMGVEFNRQGTLNLNMEKFNKVLNSDPANTAAFLRGDGLTTGFIPTIKMQVDNLMNGAFGGVTMRKKTLNDKMHQLDERIDTKNRQLEKKEEQLRAKFSDLEAQMSKLNQQGSAVAGLQGALRGGG